MPERLWYLDEIRDAITAPQNADPDQLREAALAYNDACRSANSRLREISRLLRQGLRSEAIQAADQDPPVLELFADLDFPQRDEWQGMLAQWGMDQPPALETDTASQLNTAYAELLPLEQLLRRHRLLSLSRAPLWSRIEILRQIAAKDSDNSSWVADLETYEQARLREMRSEIRGAQQDGDVRRLQQLARELSGAAWTIDVPPELARELAAVQQSVAVAAARRRLGELLPKLEAAYGELAVDAAIGLADQWRSAAQVARLSDDDPLALRVKEALHWTDQEAEAQAAAASFEEACRTLEHALDENRGGEELERLQAAAERFGQPIPSSLARRTTDRLDALAAHRRQRGRAITAVAIVAILVSAAGATALWRNTKLADDVQKHAATVEQLIENEQWNKAIAYLDALDSPLQADPELARLRVSARRQLDEESERQATVAQQLDVLEASAPGEVDAQLLRDVKKLVKLPDERRRIAMIELAMREAKTEQQAEVDRALLAVTEKWRATLQELEERPSLTDVKLYRVQSQLSAELAQYADASANLKQAGKSLVLRLRTLRDRVVRQKEEQQQLDALFAAVGDVSRYAAQLQEVVRAQPDSTSGIHAQLVLENQAAWEAVVAWSDFWQAHDGDLATIDRNGAQAILTAGDKLTGRTPENPLSEAFVARKPVLETAAARSSVDAGKLKSTIVTNPLCTDVYLVVNEAGDRFYCAQRPDDTGTTTIRFEYFTDYATKKRFSLRNDQVSHLGLAPQCTLSDECVKKLTDLEPANWDATFYRLAEEIRASEEAEFGLDSVFALDALRSVLKHGSAGSYLFDQAYADLLDEIDDAGINLAVRWFNPNDKEAAQARREAKAFFKGIGDLGQRYRDARDRQGALTAAPDDVPRWRAALRRSDENRWECVPALPADTNGDLVVAWGGPNGTASLTKVGTCRAGTPRWTVASTEGAMLVGQLVFVRPFGNQ